jgi:hypothetical protein
MFKQSDLKEMVCELLQAVDVAVTVNKNAVEIEGIDENKSISFMMSLPTEVLISLLDKTSWKQEKCIVSEKKMPTKTIGANLVSSVDMTHPLENEDFKLVKKSSYEEKRAVILKVMETNNFNQKQAAEYRYSQSHISKILKH